MTDMSGVAAKSRRIAVGDILVKVNGQSCNDLMTAVPLLTADTDTVELTFMYGFVPSNDHMFDAPSATFKQKAESSPVESIGQVVRRSLSFGKKKRVSFGEKVDTRRLNQICDVRFDLCKVDLAKGLRFAQHPITNAVIVNFVSSEIADCGLSVGDRVCSFQGAALDDEGGSLDSMLVDNLDAALFSLSRTTGQCHMTVQKRCLRTETLTRRSALRGTTLDKL